jgi:hypothetical protein
MENEKEDGMPGLAERTYRGSAASGVMGGGGRTRIEKAPEGPVVMLQKELEKECAVLLESVKLLENRLTPILADVPQPEEPEGRASNTSSPLGQYLNQVIHAVNLAHTRVRQVIERLEV